MPCRGNQGRVDAYHVVYAYLSVFQMTYFGYYSRQEISLSAGALLEIFCSTGELCSRDLERSDVFIWSWWEVGKVMIHLLIQCSFIVASH